MSERIEVLSPVDGSVYADRPVARDGEVEAALARARAAQAEWCQVPIAERGRFILAMLDAMLAMKEELVPELAWQMGRPVRYGGEFGGFEERLKWCVENAAAALEPIEFTDQPGFRRYIKRQPAGVVFVIAPWNYPYLTALNTIVPALLSGSAVIHKAASQTLLVGERFQQAFDDAGVPAGLFQNLVLSHRQSERIIADNLVDHVNFTGSVSGGRAIEKAAAGTFTTLGLELGGKDPAFVRADAEIGHAVENLVDGAFYNSGQCCCGIERIYVHEKVFKEFVGGFVDLTRKYVLGDPLDEATTLGPMANAKGADFVREQVQAATRSGAKAHIDARDFDRSVAASPYCAPQVLTKVNHQMWAMREESFGPVVGIMKVADDEEAIRLMNDSQYGLTASIWTGDADVAASIGERVETGTVYMNRCDYLDPALAWTGVKNTGRGASLSQIGFEMLTRPKSFHLREVI
ncbi:MAG: aldehyde dehydrogenase family protein [Rhizobiales bacterium]|nr:aldehyde dehydrogenase family protein [Hyphomicrobiales bacterium]